MCLPVHTEGWSTLVDHDALYGQVQARVQEGVPRSDHGRAHYQHRYGACGMPEFTHDAKAAYLARQSDIDRGVEQAVDQFRVNAFFQLLEHVMTEE